MPAMDAAEAHIDLARDGRLFVRPGPGSSLRKVERALRLGGIDGDVDAAAGGVRVAVAEFDAVRAALAGVTVKAAAAATAAGAHVADRAQWHSAALAACRRYVAAPSEAAAALAGYDRVGDLDPHQVTAVAVASHPDVRGLCIFDEQGLGKTVEALFAFDRLREQELVTRALVFAPKNMLLEWVHDLGRFFGEKYSAAVAVGPEVEKRAVIGSGADLLVTNFETAAQLEVRLRHFLEAERGRALLIVDESFFVKNAQAVRAQALRSLRRCAGRCLVLCGTPAPNSAIDLVEQFNIADDGAAFQGVTIPNDPDEARTLIREVVEERGVYLRRIKQAVLPDLPERSFNQVRVPLAPRQRSLYEAARQGLIDDLRTVDDDVFRRQRASFMARRAALLQICSNPGAVDPCYDELPAKLAAIDELLEDLIDRRGEKVLLWSFFTRSIEGIMERYGRYQPVRIDGSVTNVADRREAVRRFQEDADTMLFVANPAAAGAGLTLHRARFAVYESMSNQAAHYLQSLDRIHRRGQKRPVDYIVLLCDETIEVPEYERLLEKERAAQDLLGDEVVAPATRSTLLAELLQHQGPARSGEEGAALR
jgi:SNF2 family DNA or RNA helicase